MKVMGNKITYHSPSRGCSMEMGAAITVSLLAFPSQKEEILMLLCRSYYSLNSPSPSQHPCVSPVPPLASVSAMER